MATAMERYSSEEIFPALHFGVMGYSDMVIKCAENRDQIARNVGAIAFEMELASLNQKDNQPLRYFWSNLKLR